MGSALTQLEDKRVSRNIDDLIIDDSTKQNIIDQQSKLSNDLFNSEDVHVQMETISGEVDRNRVPPVMPNFLHS